MTADPIARHRRSSFRWFAVLFLALCMVGIALRHQGKAPFVSEEESSGGLVEQAALSAAQARFPDHHGSSRLAHPPRTTDPLSGDFTHVPEWIPTQVKALSVVAEDATLRSDGLREGRVSFAFGENADEQVAALRSAITTAGLLPLGAETFESAVPPRRCMLIIETPEPKLTRATLDYSDAGHDAACTCPTCGEGAHD